MASMKVTLIMGALVGAAFLSYTLQRDADFTFKNSSEKDGTVVYTFTSDIAPALPRDPGKAGALDKLLTHVGLIDTVKEVPIRQAGVTAWKWALADQREVVLVTKRCVDGVTCVSAVRVVPSPETRDLHLNAARHKREQIKERLAERRKDSGKVSTKGGYPACRSDQWLSDLMATLNSGDSESRAVYYLTGKCTIIGAGEAVTMVDWPGLLGGRASFLYKGQKYWTVREGLEY